MRPFDDGTKTLRPRDSRAPAELGELRVVVVAGPDAGAAHAFTQAAVTIGRSGSAEVRLTDPAVSSFHVELTPREDGVRVVDLNSHNGTFAAGLRLDRALVPTGTELLLGASRVRVELGARQPAQGAAPESFGELRGTSPAMRELFRVLARLARTELAVMLEGETGTGKELAARGLHAASSRAGRPFVVLDCGAIPAGLAESVLFGHEKGAFTGAHEARAGVFEQAEGGTLFLDEVGELPADLQPKLLRVLERREITRVGAARVRPLDLAVVSATWRDLRAMVNQGRFREDLYYRLAQARVKIPALRDRPGDTALLVAHFLGRRPPDAVGARAIAPDALAALARREMPGNVRELKHTVERLAALAEGPVVTAADVAFERMLHGADDRAPPSDERASSSAAPPATPRLPPPPLVPEPRATDAAGDEGEPLEPFKEAKRGVVEEFERAYLRRLLARAGGSVTRASQIAGMQRHSMRDLLRRHGLRVSDE